MAKNALEIDEAQVGFEAPGCSGERAERLARRMFSHLNGMLEPGCMRVRSALRLAHVEPPPLELDWQNMDDEAIARAAAAWIYRWIHLPD